MLASPSTHNMNSKTAMLQSIIAQNNQSVSLIERGEYEEAIVGFTSSISQWKTVIHDESSERSLESSTRTADEPSLPPLDKLMASDGVSCPMTTHIQHQAEDEDEHFEFLYEACILFPLDLDLARCENAFVASVVVFNLALAHQLWARSGLIETADAGHDSVNTPRKVLVRASHLYDKCFKLAKEYSQYPKGSVLFQLAIANNMGVLYSALDRLESSEKCFQYVLATLMVLTAYRNYTMSPILQNTSEETIGGFFANTTVLVTQAIGAPAA
ncbi:MAG: hypothetical protein SGILL_000633 [Bacillariaceae sp.]